MGKYLKIINHVGIITFPSFAELGVKHGFSTRIGGVSEGRYATMNLGFSTGDTYENVLENHRRFADAVGYHIENAVFSHQVHKSDILTVTKSDCGKGMIRESDIREKDGLVTNEKDVVLITSYADCVPLFFADTRRRVVGMAHSGWRGTVAKIGKNMVGIMKKEYGCRPEDIHTVVGPSICKTCYEVSEDVAEEFKKSFASEFWDEILEVKHSGKYQLDLWMANKVILQEAGIKAENIEISGICTCCHSELLFSHRATGGKRGAMVGAITL